MKALRLLAVLLALTLLVAVAPVSAQTPMTTAQKIKLTVAPIPAGSIPAATALVWSVDGSTPTNILGTFTDVAGEFAAYYAPEKAGTQVVRVSMVVGGVTLPASITLAVTLAPPSSITIVAGVPIPK
jgi:hypothetical protein